MKKVYAVAFRYDDKSRDVMPDLVFHCKSCAKKAAEKRSIATAPDKGYYFVMTLYVQDDGTSETCCC